ncbi:MAG: hypothetical protein BGO69_08225 [Bacteroidetes bacterium 46-16]|nr:MAG: hypothetical protein BGO69_08225 [Bacteroidetes bacterium 46-16]
MVKVLITAFVIVVLYRFLTRFVFPVFKLTKQARDHMQKMQQQMQDMEQQRQQGTQHSKPLDGDYIEYEEVK